MNTRDWKVYILILAIIVAGSFCLASVAKAADTEGDPNRSDQGYHVSTYSNPLTGTYYSTGAYWPDSGIGQAGSFTNSYSPLTGASSTASGDMVYAGGLPIYTGAGSAYGNLNYGPLTGYVNNMNGVSSYNTASAYGTGGYYGTSYPTAYSAASSYYPTTSSYYGGSSYNPATSSYYGTSSYYPTTYSAASSYYPTTSSYYGSSYPTTSSYYGSSYPTTSSYYGTSYPATSSYYGSSYPTTSSYYGTSSYYPTTSSYYGSSYPTTSYGYGTTGSYGSYGYPSAIY